MYLCMYMYCMLFACVYGQMRIHTFWCLYIVKHVQRVPLLRDHFSPIPKGGLSKRYILLYIRTYIICVCLS